MKKLMALFLVIAATSCLSGCTTGQKQAAGIGGGAVLGGIAGSAVTGGSPVGTIVGAGAGALVGYGVTK